MTASAVRSPAALNTSSTVLITALVNESVSKFTTVAMKSALLITC